MGGNQTEESRPGFYAGRGLTSKDAKQIRKVIVYLSLRLRTSIDYLSGLSVFDLFEIVKEVADFGKPKRV